MAEPLFQVKYLRPHFKISRNFIDEREEPPMFKISETHYAATWLLHPDAPKVELPTELKLRLMRSRKATNYD